MRVAPLQAAATAAAALSVVLLVGCAASEADAPAAACASAQVAPAPDQATTVRPGDTVTLEARYISVTCDDVMTGGETGTPSPAQQVPIVWEQRGEETQIASVSEHQGPLTIEIEVPETATSGPATVTVDQVSVELEVER